MKKTFKYIYLFLSIVSLSLISCRNTFDGSKKDNLSPETFLIVDTIQRFGENRFSSTIEVKWWGTDKDGFVSQYKITTSDGTFFTKRQDTTLNIVIPEAADTFNFLFEVQAVDNENNIDLTPAKLYYPVKNSPPTASFISVAGSSTSFSRTNPTYCFPVTRYEFNINDPDGINNLLQVEIVLNDTLRKPLFLSPNTNSIVIEAVNWDADSTECRLYTGNNNQLVPQTLQGLKLNSYNEFYIRAVDKVRTKSNWVKSNPIFMRKSSAKNLLVNAYLPISQAYKDAEKFYIKNLNANGVQDLDTLRINETIGLKYKQLAPDNFSQSLIFKHFTHIIWFGGDADFELNIAQKTILTFLDNGGKIFMSTVFGSNFDRKSSSLEFTPADSIVLKPKTPLFLIDREDSLINQISSYPFLYSKRIRSNASVMHPKFDAQKIYNAPIITDNQAGNKSFFTGETCIMASRKNIKGETNFILFAGDFDNYDYNTSAMESAFKKLFIEELKIK